MTTDADITCVTDGPVPSKGVSESEVRLAGTVAHPVPSDRWKLATVPSDSSS